jgi:signal transduction histidine kinase
MNSVGGNILQKYARVLVSSGLESEERALRIQALQRDIVLPIKALLIATLIYYFYFSHWLDPKTQPSTTREVALEAIGRWFLFYIAFNVVVAVVLIYVRRMPLPLLQWLVFTIGLLDALLFAALAFFTGGYDSMIYWIFLGLIIHNAACVPLAAPQIVLNICVTLSYIGAGLVDMAVRKVEIADAAARASSGMLDLINPATRRALDLDIQENPTEPFVMRIVILLLMTICCYGVEAILEAQRRRYEEAQEFAVRRAQLQTAGRLSAEIAHRLKNPLAIVNNAAFSLDRTLADGKKNSAAEQIGIIREEVDRADRILTELMGYARLAEGRVEKLNVAEELDSAIGQVFPPGADYKIEVEKDYWPNLPVLLMQRMQLLEIFVNIFQNAREALHGTGKITVTARYEADYSVVVTIADNGPGVPPDKIERIFEAYFSTKEKGTGLGLSIVKHNAELYGGTVSVESTLGKGAKFILRFPAKTLLNLAQ